MKIAVRDKLGRFIKGHAGNINYGKGTFQKGHKGYLKRSNKTSFKKGYIPWNKGLKGYLAQEKHYNWKGGITPLKQLIRHSFKYRLWRSDIFTRDNYICQNCGKRGGNVNTHHIKPFVLIMDENKIKTFEQAMNCEELWNINNGITLCEKCHKSI
jgi:hypothetical protein